jgi:hypothetical protein
MELEPGAVCTYLSALFEEPVEVLGLEALGAPAPATAPGARAKRPLKVQGYGQPVLVRYQLQGAERQAVLRTMAPNAFGHEYRADRAAGMILSYDGFNDLPHHVRARDVGVLAPNGRLTSLGEGEVFLLTDYAPGALYADDLRRLCAVGILKPGDRERARALARYLSEIHGVRRDAPELYRRHLRDAFGGGEGVTGLVDSYPAEFPLASPAWLEGVEMRLVAWRFRLKRHPERLAQLHGDFHPFNVLFGTGTAFKLLDRSRSPWGEPADDVAAMAINYLFFSLQRSGGLAPPFDDLWNVFWETYLERTGDQGILRAVQPFFVWRALVVASPVWYHVEDAVRRRLFRFVDRMLDEPVFDPARAASYLED